MKVLFLLLIVFLFIWDVAWSFLGIQPLFPWELKEILKSQNNDYRLIDVRTPMEYNWFHIKGAENYPDLLLHPDNFKVDDPEKPVIFVCLSGHRSPIVAYRLKKRGVKYVFNLTGGMLGFKLFGGATEKTALIQSKTVLIGD